MGYVFSIETLVEDVGYLTHTGRALSRNKRAGADSWGFLVSKYATSKDFPKSP